MIKSILEKIINQKLGKYIKRLSQDQLKTDLLSGQITFNNVELNEEYLNSIERSPFQIKFSSMGKLFIQVLQIFDNLQAPITKLSTVPVTVLLEDLYVLMSIKDKESLQRISVESQKSQGEILLEYVQKIFVKITKRLAQKNQKKEQEQEGYISKITNRVIDNLTIKIANINIRVEHYEGQLNRKSVMSSNSSNLNSSHQHSHQHSHSQYSFGLNIQQLSLHTADSQWKVKFLDRYKKDQGQGQPQIQNQTIRKLLRLKSLTVYWDSLQKDTKQFIMLKETHQEKFKQFIQNHKNIKQSSFRTILLDISSEARVLINPPKNINKYQFEIDLKLQPISANLRQENLKQLVNLANLLFQFSIDKKIISAQQKKKSSLKDFQRDENPVEKQLNPHEQTQLNKAIQQILKRFILSTNEQTLNQLTLKQKQILQGLLKQHKLETLLKSSSTHIKEFIRSAKQKELQKKNKGWFSKEKQLSAKQQQDLRQMIESTYLESSSTTASRPGTSPFVKLNFKIQKVTTSIENSQNQLIMMQIGQMRTELKCTKDLETENELALGLKSFEMKYIDRNIENSSIIFVKSWRQEQQPQQQQQQPQQPQPQQNSSFQKSIVNFNFKKCKKKQQNVVIQIEGQVSKIIVRYEHFLMLKVTTFLVQTSQNTQQIKTYLKQQAIQQAQSYDYTVNKDSLSLSPLTAKPHQTIINQQQQQLQHEIKINLLIVSPSLLIPINKRSYQGEMMFINNQQQQPQPHHQQQQLQCWVIDLGQLYIKTTDKNFLDNKIILQFKKMSFQHYKNFSIIENVNNVNNVKNTSTTTTTSTSTYTLLKGINITGQLIIKNQTKQILINLNFQQEVNLSICYTQYLKFMKLFDIFLKKRQNRLLKEKKLILQSKIWQGTIKKKQYTLSKGYFYQEYWAVIIVNDQPQPQPQPQHILYLFNKQSDLTYKHIINLKDYSISQKNNNNDFIKKDDTHTHRQQDSCSEYSSNDGIIENNGYKIILKNPFKTLYLKVSNSHNQFKKIIYPLLEQKCLQKNNLEKIVQQALNEHKSQQGDDEDDEFQDFDDNNCDGDDDFHDCQEQNDLLQSFNKNQLIQKKKKKTKMNNNNKSLSSTTTQWKFTNQIYIQAITIKYQQDQQEIQEQQQKQQIQSLNKSPNKSPIKQPSTTKKLLYLIQIKTFKCYGKVVKDVIQLNISLETLCFSDYVYVFEQQIEYQKLFQIKKLCLLVNYIQNNNQKKNINNNNNNNIKDIQEQKDNANENQIEEDLLDALDLENNQQQMKQKISLNGGDQKIQFFIQVQTIKINWKPDIFLQIILFFQKTILQHTITQPNHNLKQKISNPDIDVFSKENPQFWSKKTQYQKLIQQQTQMGHSTEQSPKNSIKRDYRLRLQFKTTQISLNFFDRESHLRIFKLQANKLGSKVFLKNDDISSQVTLDNLCLFDTTGYPKESYKVEDQKMNKDFPILYKSNKDHLKNLNRQPDNQSPPALLPQFFHLTFFKYGDPFQALKHQNLKKSQNQFPRFDTFMNVNIQSFTVMYFQQVFMRIIDYSLIQILILLTQPKLLIANESLKLQMNRLTGLQRKPDIKKMLSEEAILVLFEQYEDLLKKILFPMFPRMQIRLNHPKFILKANKQDKFEAQLNCGLIQIESRVVQANKTRVNDKMFNIHPHLTIYQEQYILNVKNSLVILNERHNNTLHNTKKLSNYFDSEISFTRLLNQPELQKIYPNINFVRDLNTKCKIPSLKLLNLTRSQYQNILKILNCNITYNDNHDEIFIHNYKIAKLKDPNCLSFSLDMQVFEIGCTTVVVASGLQQQSKQQPKQPKKQQIISQQQQIIQQPHHHHLLQEKNSYGQQSPLIKLNMNDLQLNFYQNIQLNSKTTIRFSELFIYGSEQQQHLGSGKNNNLKKNHNHNPNCIFKYSSSSSCSFSNKQNNSYELQTKKSQKNITAIIQINMKQLDKSKKMFSYFSDIDLYVNTKTLAIASQWFIPQQWIYPKPPETNPLIQFQGQLKNINITIPLVEQQLTKSSHSQQQQHPPSSQGFKIIGDLSMQFTRKQTLSLQFLKTLLYEGLLSDQQIRAIGQNTSIGLNMASEIYYFKDTHNHNIQRKILNKTYFNYQDKMTFALRKKAQQSQQSYLINKSDAKISLSDSKLKISLHDYLLGEMLASQMVKQYQSALKVIKIFKNQQYSRASLSLSKQKPGNNNNNHSTLVQVIDTVQQSNRQNIQLKIDSFDILIYNIFFNPVLQLTMNKIYFDKIKSSNNDTIASSLNFEAKYFNHENYSWQPFIQENGFRMLMTNSQQKRVHNQRAKIFSEISLTKQLRINISKSFAIALRQIYRVYTKYSCKFDDGLLNSSVATTGQNIHHYLLKEKEDKTPTPTGSHKHSQRFQNSPNTTPNPSSSSMIEQFQKQFISYQLIRNQTGYPIEIYDAKNTIRNIIMHGESIEYELQLNDQNKHKYQEQSKKTKIGFRICHPEHQLMKVTNIPLHLENFVNIKQKSLSTGEYLKDTIHCASYVQNFKKVLFFRSNKLIKDYSQNSLKKIYLAFDHPDKINLTQPQKQPGVSLVSNSINQRIKSQFSYIANDGKLQIKKQWIVYNFTPIPLTVCDYIALPEQFVGVSERLTIQGIPYDEQNIVKVKIDKAKKTVYLYALSYIVDYTNGEMQYYFENRRQNNLVKEFFSYEFQEGKKTIRILLLSKLQQNLLLRRTQGWACGVFQTKIGKQTKSFLAGDDLKQFNIRTFLKPYPSDLPIKEIKKVIQVTEAVYLVNRTNYALMILQRQCQTGAHFIESGEKIPFYWHSHLCPKQFQIAVQLENFGISGYLNVGSHQSFLIPHESGEVARSKIFSLVYETTDNISFLIVQELDQSRCVIRNNLPGSVLYIMRNQGAKDQRQSSSMTQKGAEINKIQLHYQETIPLVFYQPLSRKNLEIKVELRLQNDKKYIERYSSWNLNVSNEQLNNTLFQKPIELSNTQVENKKKKVYLRMGFNQKKKQLTLSGKSQKLEKQSKKLDKKLELMVFLPEVYLSVIGSYKGQRKQLIVIILKKLGFEMICTDSSITYNIALENFRIENLFKANPLFQVLVQPAQNTRCYMKIVFCRDLYNMNLIKYLGFSVDATKVNITSEEIGVLQENMNQIIKSRQLTTSNASDKMALIKGYNEKLKLPYSQRQTKNKIKAQTILYFIEAEIYPIRVILTFKTVSDWGGLIGRAFGNINDCGLDIDGKKVEHFSSPNISSFIQSISKHFEDQAKREMFSFIKSIGIISVPFSLISKVGFGVKNLVVLPAKGFKDGPLGIGKGVLQGTGSLLKNTFQGVFGGAETITTTLGNGLSLISGDDDYLKKRCQIKNKKSGNVIQGVGHGAQSIFHGVTKGVTGVFTQPVKGAKSGGFGGFLLGSLKGVTGLVSKPATGIIDGVSKTAQGIKNTTSVFDSEQKRRTIQRQYLSRPFYTNDVIIKTYDKALSFWNDILIDNDPVDFSDLKYVNYYRIKPGKNPKRKLVLIISTTKTMIVDENEAELIQFFDNSSIRKIQQRMSQKEENQPESMQIIVRYGNMDNQNQGKVQGQGTNIVIRPKECSEDAYRDLNEVFNGLKLNYKYEK